MKDCSYTFQLKCYNISTEYCAYFAYLLEFTYFDLELQEDSWSSDLTIKLQLGILSIEQEGDRLKEIQPDLKMV